jgi:hypothetical protein
MTNSHYSESQAELKEAESIAREITKLAAAIRRDGRFALAGDADLIIDGVRYFGTAATRKICSLAKSTFWHYRRTGKFPQYDYDSYHDKYWSETNIRLWMMERMQSGISIQPYATQRSWKENRSSPLVGRPAARSA